MAFMRHPTLPNTGVIAAFPTCIYQGQYIDHVKYNARLLEMIKTLETDPTITESSKANYGTGWTSYHATNGDFYSKYNLANSPVTEELQTFIWDSVKNYFMTIGIDPIHLEFLRLGVVWANVNPKYSYHTFHTHENSYYSGCYYVKVPKNSGDIVFKDPRNSLRLFELSPGENQKFSDAVVRQIPMNPLPGSIVLFPSWLEHEVQQNLTDDDRVSIAFNIIPDYEKIGQKTSEMRPKNEE
jgi:uncharacterized protein (TIGR02466 family)